MSTPILEPIDIRQPNHWECGACASMSAASLFAVGPDSLAGWVKLLGTSEAKSTSPQAIVKAFTDLGLDVNERQKMTIDDLAASVAAGRPVICCCQDYTGIRSANATFDYGHWVVVIGVLPAYCVIQDSSIENALGIPRRRRAQERRKRHGHTDCARAGARVSRQVFRARGHRGANLAGKLARRRRGRQEIRAIRYLNRQACGSGSQRGPITSRKHDHARRNQTRQLRMVEGLFPGPSDRRRPREGDHPRLHRRAGRPVQERRPRRVRQAGPGNDPRSHQGLAQRTQVPPGPPRREQRRHRQALGPRKIPGWTSSRSARARVR